MQPVLIVGGIRAGLAVPERLKGRRFRLCSWAASIINSIGRRSIRARLRIVTASYRLDDALELHERMVMASLEPSGLREEQVTEREVLF